MSEAAAAFFAKKKKKKAFKFNANLVDIAAVSKVTHIDAPALSKEVDTSPAPATGAASNTATNAYRGSSLPEETADRNQENGNGAIAVANDGARGDQQWEEDAMGVPTRKGVPSSANAPEVLDMKSLAQSTEPDNIAEKLRVEETKAQLAAAREGMEREAAKLREEKERKEATAKAKEAQRVAATGGIWVAPHMRAGATRSRFGAAAAQAQRNIDVASEEMFPDLAAADKILESKEKNATTIKVPKKTPVGGGASWATKPKTPAKPPMKKSEKPKAVEKPKVPEPVKVEPPAPAPVPKPAPAPVAEPPAPAPAPAPAPVVVAPKKKSGKKKKKDLSTFKPGGS